MRTAEEIIKWAFDNTPDNSMISDVYIVAVNEARIEAINECAENATANYEVSQGGYVEPFVDKQSILSLIKQVE